MDESHLWYFAYGSNMSRGTFLERRGMLPRETHVASLDGYKLSFDIPVGPGERGVANLASETAAVTHGVAYLLTLDDAERLDRTEGVPRIYVRHPVRVQLADARTVQAFTYLSTISVPTRKPSPRYIGLLLDGARAHGLPEAYIRVLEAFELAIDERVKP
jgi:cation transport regulator ChaC